MNEAIEIEKLLETAIKQNMWHIKRQDLSPTILSSHAVRTDELLIEALALLRQQDKPKSNLWLAKDYIKKALNRWDLDGKYWAKEALVEIEKAEKPCGWIPVSKRSPKKTGEYLILPHTQHLPTLWYQDGWYWYDRTDDAISETLGHNMETPLPIVTHWMPIPTLSTEKPCDKCGNCGLVFPGKPGHAGKLCPKCKQKAEDRAEFVREVREQMPTKHFALSQSQVDKLFGWLKKALAIIESIDDPCPG